MRSSSRPRRVPALAGAAASLVLFTSVSLVPRQALATPTFPDVITRELQLAAPPPCSTCHSGGITRRGTVTTPFGTTMRSRGLSAYDEASLRTALTAITAEKKDSDADGTPDVAELQAGTDPNVAAGEDLPAPPEYGCAAAGARPVAGDRAFLGLSAVIAALVLTLRVRRRAWPAACTNAPRR